MVRRRTYLAGVVPGLASLGGCNQSSVDDVAPTSSGSRESTSWAGDGTTDAGSPVAPTASPPGTSRQTDLDGSPFDELRVGTVPGESPFTHAVTVLRGATADHPPALSIEISNSTDELRELRTANSPLPFPKHAGSTETDDRLWIDPSPRSELDAVDDCWKTSAVGSDGANDVVRLESGESLEQEYAVLSADTNAECWPSGEYEFRQPYDVPTESAGELEYDWGFSLVVSE